jgi:cell division protein FtsI (penicillin-binding protein 3)
VNKWSGSSIGSLAIGQEVGVTPLQLVSMVSTIANGGVYLPPRVLMPGQVDGTANDQTPATPQAFRPGGDLPNPLPPGAHRVISTLTAAEMRKMMEGVVLYGTGKPAQLDGYSSGGKTGTAQKIDPVTHRYSKTMHIASFAGFAPVNNPVIAVAVVIDDPKGAYYGTAVSAPVFAEVAQQVLEYLGVPHDIDLRPARAPAKAEAPAAEDDADQNAGDINVLYDAANDLPSDDPLRGGGDTSAPAASQPQNAPQPAAAGQSQSTAMQPHESETVVIADGKKLRVPSLIGLSVRKVIETAAAAGLEVEISGSGITREQAPAPGTMVAPGTRIVVRCTR